VIAALVVLGVVILGIIVGIVAVLDDRFWE